MPPSNFTISHEVSRALNLSLPLVALESAVITHGLPHPHNLSLARDMESRVREEGAIPATIAVLEGAIRIGLSEPELTQLAGAKDVMKISQRDFATAITQGASGGTTVAGTMFAAHTAGIQVFATGGIGGVHRGHPEDISADLVALASVPLVVVCAGAKAILDLPRTLERLETLGVPVVGYRTDAFPAFTSRSSGLPVPIRADSPEDVAAMALARDALGLRTALLVCVPVPMEAEWPWEEAQAEIEAAVAEAEALGVGGSGLTPFLLTRLREQSGGRSQAANEALLVNNVRVAARIAGNLVTG